MIELIRDYIPTFMLRWNIHVHSLISNPLFLQKRFYTRGTLRSIRITRLAKIATLYCEWLRSLKKKRVTYLSCTEGKKGLVKTFTAMHTKCRTIWCSIIKYFLFLLSWHVTKDRKPGSPLICDFHTFRGYSQSFLYP